jgi:rhodanese-related sulfurtransferase
MRRLVLALLAMPLAIAAEASGPEAIEPEALVERIAWADRSLLLLDVRTPAEFAAGHIPGAINIPHTELATRMAELEVSRDSDIVVYCRSGARAATALGVLEKSGFKRTFHLQGDYTRWSDEKRPVVMAE